MKMTYDNGPRKMKVTAEFPDERLRQLFVDNIHEKLWEEFRAFTEEINVALRKLPMGKKRVMKSRPIEVTIEQFPGPVIYD